MQLLAKVIKSKNLTRQENKVVLLILQGLSNREIAAILRIKDKSTRSHVTNVYKKFQVKSRAQLIAFFLSYSLNRLATQEEILSQPVI